MDNKTVKECPIAPGIFVDCEGNAYDMTPDGLKKLEPMPLKDNSYPKVRYLRCGHEITFSLCVLMIATFFETIGPIMKSEIGYKDEDKENCTVQNLYYKPSVSRGKAS